jgi:hypothetical protein
MTIYDSLPGSTRFKTYLGLALVLVVSVSVLSGCLCPMQSQSNAWENRCILTLRAIGSSQIAFADQNNGEFGTWDEMKKQEYIQQGYNYLNLIDNYKIVVFNVQKSIKDKDGKIISPSSFVIVAVPNEIKSGLRTFAIDSDQTVRAWIGDSKDFDIATIDLKNENQWEPAPTHKARKRHWSPF